MKVSPEIESLVAYKPGKPIEETKKELGLTDVCKLASNENPLGVSEKVVATLQKEVTQLHRYPDPSCRELREFLADKWSLKPEQLLIGNGSNELIDLVIRVFCEPGDRILMPKTSFIAYAICSQAARVGKKEFPLDENHKVKVDELISYINEDKTSSDKVLFLANPNNPTGSYLTQDEMKRILEACGKREDLLVVIDEAYNEFVRADDYVDSLDLVAQYENVLVLRTFSKVYGLAGLRVGALVGSEKNLDYVHRVRNPFNVNHLAQKAVIAAMNDEDYLKKSQQIVWNGLDYFYEQLTQLNLPFYSSQANFVLFDSQRDGQKVFDYCLRKGVILRPLFPYKLPTHLRMNVGLEDENQRAIEVLAEMVKEVEKI